MSNYYTKTVKIFSINLPRDTTLMFTFEPPAGVGLYVDYFPIAWRVEFFPSQGYQFITLTYTAQLMFLKAEVVVLEQLLGSTGTFIPIDPGQSTTLIARSTSFVWEPPTNIGGSTAKAINGTSAAQDIVTGFMNGHNPQGILFYDKVGSGDSAPAQIRGIMKIYVTDRYVKNQIIRREVEGVKLLALDMTDVKAPSEYELTFNTLSSAFQLTPTDN